MTVSLEGRVALVTGAGRGLGRAYALDLARAGAAVVVNDVAGADGVAQEIRSQGGSAVATDASVTTPEGGEAMVAASLEAFDGLDIVVHNAGFVRPAYLEEMSWQDLDEILDVHLRACFYVCKPALPVMQGRSYGRIVLISSSAGAFGLQGQTNYNAAKAGVLGFSRSLALESATHGILVNAVLPYAASLISRDRPLVGRDVPQLKAGREPMEGRTPPESVAPLVTYLASDACKTTGEAFSACAGRFARVAVGVGAGWLSDDAVTTPEAVEEHWSQILSLDGLVVPTWVDDEVRDVIRQLEVRANR